MLDERPFRVSAVAGKASCSKLRSARIGAAAVIRVLALLAGQAPASRGETRGEHVLGSENTAANFGGVAVKSTAHLEHPETKALCLIDLNPKPQTLHERLAW